jgi:hypothetical protein
MIGLSLYPSAFCVPVTAKSPSLAASNMSIRKCVLQHEQGVEMIQASAASGNRRAARRADTICHAGHRSGG